MQITTINSENAVSIPPQNDFPKFPILFQIVLGFLCGGLNFLPSCFQSLVHIPLYLDTVFTSLASFFSLASGLISATAYHFLCLIVRKQELYHLIWLLCSYSIVFTIRIYIRKKSKLFLMDLINLTFLTAVIISIEGALIFTILHTLVKYNENSAVRTMFLMLIRSNFSIFVSALLPRIPVNILDKAINIAFGFFVYKGIKKLYEAAKTKSKPAGKQEVF